MAGPLHSDLHPVVVIGAGISGLAVAYRLRRMGIQATMLDQARQVAESWRGRHPQLRLNTHRHYSRLPGPGLPRHAGPFATRDEVIDYLADYAHRLEIPIRQGIRVDRVDPVPGAWAIQTATGLLHARHVVLATGRERVPVTPDWPGMTGFSGEIIHAADFGDVERYRQRRILVVGAGNSGIDVLNHLVRIPTRELRLSVRHGSALIPARLGGVPVQRLSGLIARLPLPVADTLLAATERLAFGDLGRFGLPRRGQGAATRLARSGVVPAVDDGFVEALQSGRVAVVPAVKRFRGSGVVLADGCTLRPEIVICATGYRPGLESMVGHLDVLDGDGVPRRRNPGVGNGACPGLWFIGMWPRLEGTFYAARIESRGIAREIHRSLMADHRRFIN